METLVGSGIKLQNPTAATLISLIQKGLEWKMSSSTSLSALVHTGLKETHILSGHEIKRYTTQVSLICVSVLTMIAFKNRCSVSALAPTDWLLQPDQVLWHCEDRHHDLWGDWVLRKRFSAGKEFCRFPSTPKLSNFKVRKRILYVYVSGPHAVFVDWASGGGFLIWSFLSLAWFFPAFPRCCGGCHQFDGSQQPENEVRCKQGKGRTLPRQEQQSVFMLCPLWGL